MAYTTFTLTGTYQHFNGDPAEGVIEIIPSERVVKDTTGDVILSGRVKVTLDATGTFAVDLPDPNDATLNPTGFGYTVVAKLHHAHLPAVSFGGESVTGAVVNVEDVTPVDPSTFEATATYAESTSVTAIDARVTTLEESPSVSSWDDLTDKPAVFPPDTTTLATVATTGAYGDLSGQPTIPTTAADIGAADDAAFQAVATDVNEHDAELEGRLSEAGLNAAFARLPERLQPIEAGMMSAGTAAVVRAQANNLDYYQLRDGQNDLVTIAPAFDTTWTTYNVDAWLVNTSGTATGDVRLRWDTRPITDPLNSGGFVSGAAVTVTAGAQAVGTKYRIATGAAVDPTQDLQHRLIRLGTDAADTLAASIGVWRVEITRAS